MDREEGSLWHSREAHAELSGSMTSIVYDTIEFGQRAQRVLWLPGDTPIKHLQEVEIYIYPKVQDEHVQQAS